MKFCSVSWIFKLNIHLHINVLSGILKNQIMMQIKELLNLWIGILCFHVKMYMNRLFYPPNINQYKKNIKKTMIPTWKYRLYQLNCQKWY